MSDSRDDAALRLGGLIAGQVLGAIERGAIHPQHYIPILLGALATCHKVVAGADYLGSRQDVALTHKLIRESRARLVALGRECAAERKVADAG